MVIKEIINRRSVRKYKPDTVPDNFILEIIKAGQFAPTARNNRAAEFIVIKDQKTKDEIFNIVGQDYVKEAGALIVPVSDKTKTNCPVQDLSVVSENMLLQAEALGLGGVWKNLKGDLGEETKIKKILGIPEQFMVINFVPLGFPVEKPEPHSDKDFDTQKIHQEKW
jgi:nitroreductase